MRRGGRSRLDLGLLTVAYFLVKVHQVTSTDYGIPIEIKLWDTGRTPLVQMVDVTNGFGLKVLAEHNFFNENNIAFSPYGLMGILVALYEGVDGECSYQIQRGMQLPWNRNVMRVGFRDIHRTLKTYFVPEEGFLAGLALNNENVTFNENYKKILRFYGFDLDNDQLPTLAPQGNGTNETSSSTVPLSGDTPSASVTTTTESMTIEDTTTRAVETTTNANAETINEVDIRGPVTTDSPSSAANAESTSILSMSPTDTPIPSTTATSSVAITVTTIMTTTPTTVANTESLPPTVVTETDATSQRSSNPVTDEPTVNNEVDILTTQDITPNTNSALNSVETSTTELKTDATVTTESISTESTTTVSSETDATTNVESTTTMSTIDTTQTTESTREFETTMSSQSTLETLQRRKKSIVDFIFTNPPYVDDYLVYRSYDIGPETPSNKFDDEQVFLVNGLRNVQVTYMHYDTILDHAYLPHLEASALRLPLDSDRYYLLVVLPTRGGAPELGRLLARMARESDLSDIHSALRPRRVRAIVPSFTVKGHITLTTDLQKLGIRDVFEPRQHDFSPMTHQPGVYVRSIEQAVSVAIRKYAPDDHKKNRYVANRIPVRFSATYPFLYFVMDASIHVALMAGKMVDPLNTRIL